MSNVAAVLFVVVCSFWSSGSASAVSPTNNTAAEIKQQELQQHITTQKHPYTSNITTTPNKLIQGLPPPLTAKEPPQTATLTSGDKTAETQKPPKLPLTPTQQKNTAEPNGTETNQPTDQPLTNTTAPTIEVNSTTPSDNETAETQKPPKLPLTPADENTADRNGTETTAKPLVNITAPTIEVNSTIQSDNGTLSLASVEHLLEKLKDEHYLATDTSGGSSPTAHTTKKRKPAFRIFSLTTSEPTSRTPAAVPVASAYSTGQGRTSLGPGNVIGITVGVSIFVVGAAYLGLAYLPRAKRRSSYTEMFIDEHDNDEEIALTDYADANESVDTSYLE